MKGLNLSEWALKHQSPMILLGMQYYTMLAALTGAKERFDVLVAAARDID